MVKEITFSADVPCSVQEFYEAVFAGSAVAEFHREYDGDPCTSVGPWEDNMRLVAFTVQLKLPAFVRRAIGTEALQVKETQRLEWREGGAELLVSSEPRIDVSNGAQFATNAQFLVRPRAANGAAAGCVVVATVTCSAAGPWGMVGAIETIMASQAQTSVGAFIGFCVRRCAGSAPGAEGSMDAGLGLGPGYLLRPSGGDMDVEGSDGEAAFYEAAESLASFSDAGTAPMSLEAARALDALQGRARELAAAARALSADILRLRALLQAPPSARPSASVFSGEGARGGPGGSAWGRGAGFESGGAGLFWAVGVGALAVGVAGGVAACRVTARRQ